MNILFAFFENGFIYLYIKLTKWAEIYSLNSPYTPAKGTGLAKKTEGVVEHASGLESELLRVLLG